MSSRDVRTPAAPAFGWALAAVLATIATWPVVFHAGLPAFFHDWTWPLFRDRMLATWQLQVSAWSGAGLGAPNSVPTANPLAWMKLALATVTPGDTGAKWYLWLSVAAACAGVFRLAHRTLGVDARWASFGAAMFAVSPYLFAKIASGQSSEWAAIAAYVWAIAWMIDAYAEGDVAAAAGAALLFALSTNQLQYLVFSELAALIGLCAFPSRRGAAVWLTIAAGTVVFAFPSLWFLAQRGPLASAGISLPYRSWELSQSSSPGDAFALLGYAAHYPEQRLSSLGPWAVPAVKWAMWAIGACAAAGAIWMRDRRSAVLATLGAAGFFWTSGLRGPAGAFWQWAFAHVPAASFLREFFHGATMLMIPYAALSAFALSRLEGRVRSAAFGAACVLLGASGLATWSGGLGPVLPHVVPPAYSAELAKRSWRDVSRVLFLPPERPLFVAGDRVGGEDAFDWISTDVASPFEYYPRGPLAFASAALDRSHVDEARRVLSRLGCGAIVWRPDVRSPLWSAGPAELQRALKGGSTVAGGAVVFSLETVPMIGGARATAPLPPSLQQMAGDTSLVYLDDPGVDASAYLPAGLWSPDPVSGWVGYRDLYWMFEGGLATPTLGLLTTRARSTIAVPGGDGSILVWAPRGMLVGRRPVVAPEYVRVRRSAATLVLTALGPAAVGEVGENAVNTRVRPSSARGRRVAPWRYAGTMDLRGAGIVVLRQRFDPGWVLEAAGARVLAHHRADGFGNAWLVDGDGRAAFTIDYAPQRTTFVLLAASAASAVLLIVVIPASRRQSPNGKKYGGSPNANARVP